jgi:hypothetical protein
MVSAVLVDLTAMLKESLAPWLNQLIWFITN